MYVFTFTICCVDLILSIQCAPKLRLKHFPGLHQIHTTYCKSENIHQKSQKYKNHFVHVVMRQLVYTLCLVILKTPLSQFDFQVDLSENYLGYTNDLDS